MTPPSSPRPLFPAVLGAIALHGAVIAALLITPSRRPAEQTPPVEATMMLIPPPAETPVAEPAPPPVPPPAVTETPTPREAPPRPPAPPRAPQVARAGHRAVEPARLVEPAPVREASAPEPPPDPRVSAAAAANWRSALAAWLQSHKDYPGTARRNGEQGRVVIRFTAASDGHVSNVSLIQSSGSAALDEAARGMLRGASLPPFPPGLTDREITATVPIRYQLER